MNGPTDADIDLAVRRYRNHLQAQATEIRQHLETSGGRLYAPAGAFDLATHDKVIDERDRLRAEVAELRDRTFAAERALRACVVEFGRANMPTVDGVTWDDYVPSCYCADCLQGDPCDCDAD